MTNRTDPLAEDVPDGTFGGSRRLRGTRPAPWTPKQQARHRAELAAALNGWRDTSDRATRDRERHWPRPARPTTERNAA